MIVATPHASQTGGHTLEPIRIRCVRKPKTSSHGTLAMGRRVVTKFAQHRQTPMDARNCARIVRVRKHSRRLRNGLFPRHSPARPPLSLSLTNTKRPRDRVKYAYRRCVRTRFLVTFDFSIIHVRVKLKSIPAPLFRQQ